MLQIGRHNLRVPESSDGPPDIPLAFNRLATDLSDVAKDNQGTLAARPVSTAISPGIAGRYFYVTGDPVPANNGRLWRDYGTGWVEVATPSSPQATNQRPPQSPETNLKIIRGIITTTSPGTINEGVGFTISYQAVGRVRVTFATPFSDLPSVVWSGDASGVNLLARNYSMDATQATCQAHNDAGTVVDGKLHFIAVGPA